VNFQGPHWQDRLAEQIDTVTTTVRKALRRLKYDPPRLDRHITTAASRYRPSITLSEHEARTLLRATMPFPLSLQHKRHRHAELIAACIAFGHHLVELNDQYAGEHAITGALELRAALDAWTSRMRWHQATAAAGVSWQHHEAARNPISNDAQRSTMRDAAAAAIEAKKTRR
jgi:hypothetical protein